jgi:antibiotic biosynthesis monooxygenase (ABM) superfamily enzyme
VTLVTVTRVADGQDAAFADWEQRVSDAIARYPGFTEQTVTPPSPPSQLDWVIIQRFDSVSDVQRWISSPERSQLVAEIEPLLVGSDDIHIFVGERTASPPASVSAVISTQVAPNRQIEYRSWQHRVAATEATFPGFQSAKIEPPVPGVQDDWATVVQFDTHEHLQAWLGSSERRKLLDEGSEFNQELSVRTIRGGLDVRRYSGEQPASTPAPAWKQNMVILLVLHPLAFLFAVWVLSPHLIGRGVPVSLALFVGAVVKVVLLGYLLVPQANRAFAWWLTPRATVPAWRNAAGVVLMLTLYGAGLAIFSRMP